MLTNKFLSKGNKVRGGLYQDMTLRGSPKVTFLPI